MLTAGYDTDAVEAIRWLEPESSRSTVVVAQLAEQPVPMDSSDPPTSPVGRGVAGGGTAGKRAARKHPAGQVDLAEAAAGHALGAADEAGVDAAVDIGERHLGVGQGDAGEGAGDVERAGVGFTRAGQP